MCLLLRDMLLLRRRDAPGEAGDLESPFDSARRHNRLHLRPFPEPCFYFYGMS